MKNQTETNVNEKIEGGGVNFCKDRIISIVNQIEDIWILEQIHKFIINMTKEGD